MTAEALARRTFRREDQLAFAAASGDCNPLHMDAITARRTQPGAPVVHGVHAVLWALEKALAIEPDGQAIRAVRAQFHRFIHVDQAVELYLAARDEQGLRLELRVSETTAVSIAVGLGRPTTGIPDRYETQADTAHLDAPRELAPEQMDGASGWLRPTEASTALAEAFPRLHAQFGDRRLESFALLSTLVGMVCPGLHSIFSSLDVRATAETGRRRGIGWQARRADPRYARVDLVAAGSGLEADLRALIRPAPVAPPRIDEVMASVRSGEFAGRRALVVGGSRGLGAATSMLLAAGGAEVTLTYAAARTEADALVGAVTDRLGPGRARALQCDVREPFASDVKAELATATHIYYFATPHISRQVVGVFDDATFETFTEIYVRRFHVMCRTAFDGRGDRNLNVFYPSTVAIEERPKGMTEYAMAKSAGEILCQDLMRAATGLAITIARLPRVLTDQTALAIPIRSARALDVMLPLLRDENPAGPKVS